MTTFEITYENGARPGVLVATGHTLWDAIKAAGYRNAEAFLAYRVITWRELA